MKYPNIKEEEIKNKIEQDYFWEYDCTKIIGNIDFCVCLPKSKNEIVEQEYIFWAEAKKGSSDIYKSIVQLVLTIGRERTFDKHLPPAFLGAFDAEKIAFIPYNDIQDIFYLNDFNWNVTPSNHNSKEFMLIMNKVKTIIDEKTLLFNYEGDNRELIQFIKNSKINKFGLSKIKIDKNNFIVIYNKWLQTVKPTISFNWEFAKKNGIIDGYFYLADLFSSDNNSLKENLTVVLKASKYELNKHKDEYGAFNSSLVYFNDNQKAHNQFWNKYYRPPKEEYWDYIIQRSDLIVPQDIRERKGSFFTPQVWVELSQKYLTDVLGEDWQDEYYIWDCAAGTGNLLNGLTNKYNIWASTLDKQDVEVMKDRIDNGANLLKDHVFQFDFLNDEFTKLPQPLLNIINDTEKRKKLVMYINPPYAETAKKETQNKERINKRGVSFSVIQKKYSNKIGIATKEIFAQFLIRIHLELPNSILAQFSTLKIIQGPNFFKFRKIFNPNFLKGFVVPANTFDNVKGSFPIGFMIWDLKKKSKLKQIKCAIYNSKVQSKAIKTFYAYDENKFITDWFRNYHDRKIKTDNIGAIGLYGSDFQHNNFIVITNPDNHPNRWTFIDKKNLLETSIYFTVRHCIKANWLNDRDQFLFPNDGYKKDLEFQYDCLAYTIFNNNIQTKFGTNHWIPFTEYEVGAREKFASHFMHKFISGQLHDSIVSEPTFFAEEKSIPYNINIKFSLHANAVMNAGKSLWQYYHKQPDCNNVNASLYDIKEHFQKRNDVGKMNNKSLDKEYTILIDILRDSLNTLANKIIPKVYEYGFLLAD